MNVQKIPQKQINTVGEMKIYLEELQLNASESVSAALNAQLQVIRYVSSPELIDSSLDLLFSNIDKSVKYAQTPAERDKFLEQGHLMIHNYFFS